MGVTTAVMGGRIYGSFKEGEVKKDLQKFNKPHHFPSVEQSLKFHVDQSLKLDGDVKTYLTDDFQTIKTAEKVIDGYVAEKELNQSHKQFLTNLILGKKEDESDEKGSKFLYISPIEGSEYEESHKKHLETSKKKKIAHVGGPAAVDGTLLSAMIPDLSEKIDTIFVGAGYELTNQSNSAAQVHARHGNALNADDALTGHALLPAVIKRGILKVLIGGASELEDAVDNAGYRKIHIKFTLDPEKLGIYVGNEVNWAKQKFRKAITGSDQHDLNRIESVVSEKIMYLVQEELSKKLGEEFKIIEGNGICNQNSSSIHVALTESETEEARIENKHLAEINIGSVELSRERIEELFGDNKNILAAFSYSGDGHIPLENHARTREVVSGVFGEEWLEPAFVKRVFVGNDNGKARIAGMLVMEDEAEKFIPVDGMHFTGGYTARLVHDNPIGSVELEKKMVAQIANQTLDFVKGFGVEISDEFAEKFTKAADNLADRYIGEAVSTPMTVATGTSINAIFRRTPEINKFIKEFGNNGQIAVTNSHWTELAKDDEPLIIRITGGGNTGSEKYNPNYFLNVIGNTDRIFADALVGVVRSYGCPRAINAINSTNFEEIAEGFVVSLGKGGTGNTKRFSEAVIALALLGYEDEVVGYFNKFQDDEGRNLGEQIQKMVHDFKQEDAFFQRSTDRTSAKMGYKLPELFDELLSFSGDDIDLIFKKVLENVEFENEKGKTGRALLDEKVEEIVRAANNEDKPSSVAIPNNAGKLDKDKAREL